MYPLSHFDGDLFKKFSSYKRGCTSELRIAFQDTQPSAKKNLYIFFPILVAIIQMHFNNINKSPDNIFFTHIYSELNFYSYNFITIYNHSLLHLYMLFHQILYKRQLTFLHTHIHNQSQYDHFQYRHLMKHLC